MLPSLYISHGSPMLALEPGASGPALERLAAALPRPKAIVLVSAHWESTDLRVASHPAPATWHDFGGFPPALFAVQYPAPGEPTLAAQVVHLLGEHGLSASLDPNRPFDHGAWVPLSLMYPGGYSCGASVFAQRPWANSPNRGRKGVKRFTPRRRAADRFRQHYSQPARTGLARRH